MDWLPAACNTSVLAAEPAIFDTESEAGWRYVCATIDGARCVVEAMLATAGAEVVTARQAWVAMRQAADDGDAEMGRWVAEAQEAWRRSGEWRAEAGEGGARLRDREVERHRHPLAWSADVHLRALAAVVGRDIVVVAENALGGSYISYEAQGERVMRLVSRSQVEEAMRADSPPVLIWYNGRNHFEATTSRPVRRSG